MIGEIALPVLLLFTLVAAVQQDWATHKIPNRLTGGALVGAILWQTLASGTPGAVLALTGAVVGLAGLLPFYVLGAMGAGDVKLMAAVGAILGPVPTLLALGLSLAAGGLIGIYGFFVYSSDASAEQVPGGSLLPNWNEWRGRLSRRFPYALAIALGSIPAGILSWTDRI